MKNKHIFLTATLTISTLLGVVLTIPNVSKQAIAEPTSSEETIDYSFVKTKRNAEFPTELINDFLSFREISNCVVPVLPKGEGEKYTYFSNRGDSKLDLGKYFFYVRASGDYVDSYVELLKGEQYFLKENDEEATTSSLPATSDAPVVKSYEYVSSNEQLEIQVANNPAENYTAISIIATKDLYKPYTPSKNKTIHYSFWIVLAIFILFIVATLVCLFFLKKKQKREMLKAEELNKKNALKASEVDE